MSKEAVIKEAIGIMEEAWVAGVSAILKAAGHPKDWVTMENKLTGEALIQLGPYEVNCGDIMEASFVQGALTAAWCLLNDAVFDTNFDHLVKQAERKLN